MVLREKRGILGAGGLLFLQVADVVDDGDFDAGEVSGVYSLVELGPEVVGVFSRHVDGDQVVGAGHEGVEEGVVLAALSVFPCGLLIYRLQVECYVTHGDIILSLFIFKTKGGSGGYDPLYNFHVYNGNLLFEERRIIKRGLPIFLLF